MLIPKQNRKLIYENLFKEGVLVAKKDFNAPKHQDIEVPNLQVIKACQSLHSKGYVNTQFSWQYYYYSLTDKGIEYLREYLHLPQEIVPATFKKPRPAGRSRTEGEGREGGSYRAGGRGERDYRRRDDGEGKKEGPSGDFKPEFRGGYGRGRDQPE
uniref:40S ribosomal protein S10-B n=1 Tax=Anthurium amnicola TaxID=1678845 RepID=A0A1D1YNU3_9ARAE